MSLRTCISSLLGSLVCIGEIRLRKHKNAAMSNDFVRIIAVRAVQLDHYLIRDLKAFPSSVGFSFQSPLSGREFPSLPVIRVYGPSLVLNVSTSFNKRILIPDLSATSSPRTPISSPPLYTSPKSPANTDSPGKDSNAEEIEEAQVEHYCRRGRISILHIHNVFPYFFSDLPQIFKDSIPERICAKCDGDVPQGINWKVCASEAIRSGTSTTASSPPPQPPMQKQEKCCYLRSAIYSYLENKDLGHLIWDLHFVCRHNIYGYEKEPGLYLKFSTANPQNSPILGHSIFENEHCQIYNLHIPYSVQFMSDWGVSGPDFISFLPEIVFRRKPELKHSRIPEIIEWDLFTPYLFLHQMTAYDSAVSAAPQDSETFWLNDDIEYEMASESSKECRLPSPWKSNYKERFAKDFDVPGAPSPTESLANLWIAERERRIKTGLISHHPMRDGPSYLATRFQKLQEAIELRSTLPEVANGQMQDLMQILLRLTCTESEKAVDSICGRKRKREPTEDNLKHTEIKKAKIDTWETRFCDRICGYVCAPYWSNTQDLESTKLGSLLPNYYFSNVRSLNENRSHNQLPSDCARCLLTTSQPKPPPVSTSRSFPANNSFATLHNCNFFGSNFLDEQLGKAFPLEESPETKSSTKLRCLTFSNFVYAPRPPHFEEVRSQIEEITKKKQHNIMVTPNLDSYGRLVYTAAKEIALSEGGTFDQRNQSLNQPRLLTPQKRTHDTEEVEASIFDDWTASRLSQNSLSPHPRFLSTQSDFRSVSDQLNFYCQRASVLAFKVKTIISNYVPNSFRGIMGRILFCENVLDISEAKDMRAVSDSSQALRRYELATRRRGNPDKDAIFCTVIGYKHLSTSGKNEASNCLDRSPLKFHIVYRDTNETEGSRQWRQKLSLLLPSKMIVDEEKASSEKDLISRVFRLVESLDPSVIAAWDIKHESFGYILSRAAVLWETAEILKQGSRLKDNRKSVDPNNEQFTKVMSPRIREFKATANVSQHNDTDRAFQKMTSKLIKLEGRLLLNGWQVLRRDIRLNNFSFHQVLRKVCQRLLASVDTCTLSMWWKYGIQMNSKYLDCPFRIFAVKSIVDKIRCFHDMIEQLDTLSKAATMAQVFGLELFSVLTRGSQFFVEALLSRAAKRLGYLLLTASRKQVHDQDGLEAIPMVLEPRSSFYYSPVIVVDYQSLYPSLIIGYNLCYSTCLGKVHIVKKAILSIIDQCTTLHLKISNAQESSARKNLLCNECLASGVLTYRFGVHQIKIPIVDLLSLVNPPISDAFHIMPNGSIFVNQRIKRGILPSMLQQILETRIMLKSSAKLYKSSLVKRILDHQQFSLKFVANVTYGYTGASFSGRMPCGEVADAIVSMARFCLHTTIERIEATDFGRKVEVVYGDTDSIFLHVPNATMKEAFNIGQKVVDQATMTNISPMELKLEKIYQTCCLQTKKRYTGQAFESYEQFLQTQDHHNNLETAIWFAQNRKGGFLDSKGIETIRKDQCGLVQKATGRFLQGIFHSSDFSKAREGIFKTVFDAQVASFSANALPELLQSLDYTSTIPFAPKITQRSYYENIGVSNSFIGFTMQDFIFSKDLKLGMYAWNRGGPAHTLPPQAVVALQISENLLPEESDRADANDSVFDQHEQISYLFSSMGASAKLNDQAVSVYRCVTQRPQLFSTHLVTSYEKAFLLLWHLAIGQFSITPNINYYVHRQVIQVLRRLCVLLPGTSASLSLPMEKWVSYFPKIESLISNNPRIYVHDSKSLIFAIPMGLHHSPRENPSQARDLRDVEIIEASASLPSELSPPVEEDIQPPEAPVFRAPIQALTGNRTLDTFFRKEKSQSAEHDNQDTCIACKDRIHLLNEKCQIVGKNSLSQNIARLMMKKLKMRPQIPATQSARVSLKLCVRCRSLERQACLQTIMHGKLVEQQLEECDRICLYCTGGYRLEAINCNNALHCPIYFRRTALRKTWEGMKESMATLLQ